jgi:hypothetical protein
VFVSPEPSGGSGAWAQTAADPGQELTGVSCPLRDVTAVEFCLAVDHAGNAALETNSWHVQPLDTTGGRLTGVSCTEFSEWCIAFDDVGNVLTATDPAGNPWVTAAIDPGHSLSGASCPYPAGNGFDSAEEYCVVVDQAGNVLTAAKPTDAWATSHIDASDLSDVSCASALFEAAPCVAVDTSGNALASTEPLAGATTWHSTAIDPGTALTGVSCLSANGPLCYAIAANGDLIAGEGASVELPTGTIESPPAGHDQPSPVPASASSKAGAASQSAPPMTLGGHPIPISSAQLSALLKGQLLPHGNGASIGSLLKHGGLSLPFKLPEAGTVNVSWSAAPSNSTGQAAKSRSVLIASGKLTLAVAGTGQLKIRATAVGRRLLKHAKRVKLMARATFMAGQSSSTAMQAFPLSASGEDARGPYGPSRQPGDRGIAASRSGA